MNNDLISRSALLEDIRSLAKDIARQNGGVDDITIALKEAFDMTKAAPAVDAEPVRHGRWVSVGDDDQDAGMYKCSECSDERYFGEEVLTSEEASKYCPFCPNCGAKMDGKINFTAPDDDMLGYRDTV